MAVRLGFLVAAAALTLSLASPAAAQYHNGEEGFFLFLDAIYAQPRDTDDVVATLQNDLFVGPQQSVVNAALDWDSDWGGRIDFGYRWPSGSKVAVSYWQFEDDARSSGDGSLGGIANFAIGPSIYPDSFGAFGYPGFWDIGGTIEARTIDVTWRREHEFDEEWAMEWALGLRYASFEETLSGLYDYYDSSAGLFGYYAYAVNRRNKGEMYGLKVSARGEYSFSEFLTVDSTLGISLLEGEVTGTSGLTPLAACIGPTFCP